MFIVRLFKNRNFIFILAFVLGFVTGDAIPWLNHIVVPALAVVMIVSMSQIPLSSFLPLKSLVKPIISALILNYVIFSLVSLSLAKLLINDPELWAGFVIIASAPPGVAIAPFTEIMGGDKKFSLSGVIGAHILAMILIPLYGFIFIGRNFVQPLELLILFSELIIAPFIISRIFIRFKIDKKILRWRGPIVNWGLFIVIFTVIALNRDIFFLEPLEVGIISAIAAITVLGLGFLYEFVLKKMKIQKKLHSSIILLGTIKNGGFAAAIALSLSGERASLPSAIVSVFLIIYLIILSFRAKKFKD